MIISLVDPSVVQEMIGLAKDCPPGCFVEVGVYKGGTGYYLTELAKLQGRKAYLYDTFEGIPYQGEWDSHRVGDFSDTSLEEVEALIPDAIITKGVFPASAVPMEPVAFVHLDCDQYQSIKDSVEYLLPLMVDGGAIWFDDYHCLEGATRAVDELFGERVRRTIANKAYVRIEK